MKIRSITAFLPPAGPGDPPDFAATGRALAALRERITGEGYEVQTVRAALPPLGQLPRLTPGELPGFAQELEAAAADAGIQYASLGPLRPEDDAGYGDAIVESLAATSQTFFSLLMGDAEAGVDLARVHSAARIIDRAAPLEPDGFANLRFAALSNVSSGVPFLPAAWSAGQPAFALALECADLAVEAFGGAASAGAAVERLRAAIESGAARLEPLCVQAGWEFLGFDFSPAPYPRREDSAAGALESLGLPALGRPGSVAAAALLTQAVEDANIPHAGFSGLFLPVLEDDLLALRAQEGEVGLNELLLLSAVCGTGLDTVPLPGDIGEAGLHAILLDLAALAVRAGKPLTARLMPMPGKRAGDPLRFDFPFFADGAVMGHRAGALGRALGAPAGKLPLRPRGR